MITEKEINSRQRELLFSKGSGNEEGQTQMGFPRVCIKIAHCTCKKGKAWRCALLVFMRHVTESALATDGEPDEYHRPYDWG